MEPVLVVVVYGHREQPMQYQFSQATCHPPCMVLHKVKRHDAAVVVMVLAFGATLVVFVVVDVVMNGHCGHDAQNH